MSKPSRMPSSSWASWTRVFEHLRRGRRPGGGRVQGGGGDVVMAILRAPAWRATAMAMSPMGPAPVMSTSSPTKGKAAVRCAPRSRKVEDRAELRSDGGIVVDPDVGLRDDNVSAKAPSRCTPTDTVWMHICRRPARQLRQMPQTTWPSPETRSHLDVADVLARPPLRRRTRVRRSSGAR